MSDNSFTLNNTHKVALAVGAAAGLALLSSYYLRSGNKNEDAIDDKDTVKSDQKTEDKSDKKVEVDEKLLKATQLKDEGNTYFKERKYELAIKSYTEALAMTDVDTHLLYSNRSAAYTAMNSYEGAMADAKKCIELKPEWSKGYFRLGKALQQQERFSEAYINFYHGLKLEPKSDELRKMVTETTARLPPFGERAFKFQFQAKLITIYLTEWADRLCKNLGTTNEEITTILRDALDAKQLDNLFEINDKMNSLKQKDESAILQIISIHLLVILEKPDAALKFAQKLLLVDSSDPQSCILTALVQIRQAKSVFNSFQDAMAILELIRTALMKAPQDLFVVNTYMGFIATLLGVIGAPDSPMDIPTTLKELKIVLSHPKCDKLQVVHTGIQIWFKLFEDPELQRRLFEEEREAELTRMTPHQAYLKGLISGAFRNICLDPFFLHALGEVAVPFPQLERILSPFRTAILALKPNQERDFESLSPFIYALSLQSLKNNYLWDIKEEEKVMIDNYRNEIKTMLNDITTSAPNGILSKSLLHHLSIYSMFHPLSDFENIEDLVLSLNLDKLPPQLVTLFNKSILATAEEIDIKQEIIALTPIPDSDLLQYFDSHITTFWDSPPLTCLSKVSLADELEWRYPYFQGNFNKNDKLKVLIAACGSGREVYQVYSTYKNVEITAIDYSETNLAYAIRQNRELGVEGVKYYLADVNSLGPMHFPYQFDLVIANDFIHYATDPIKAWEKLTSLTKTGGLLMLTLHNKRVVSTISTIRKVISTSFKPAIFDKNDPPRLIRHPSDDEIREARRMILDNLDQAKEPPQEVQELITSMGFYSLAEFRNLVFHPIVQGFSYKVIGQILDQLKLNLVGFDFPEIYYEKELSYKGEFYTDRNMTNFANLDQFNDKDPNAFAGFYISLTCQKPL